MRFQIRSIQPILLLLALPAFTYPAWSDMNQEDLDLIAFNFVFVKALSSEDQVPATAGIDSLVRKPWFIAAQRAIRNPHNGIALRANGREVCITRPGLPLISCFAPTVISGRRGVLFLGLSSAFVPTPVGADNPIAFAKELNAFFAQHRERPRSKSSKGALLQTIIGSAFALTESVDPETLAVFATYQGWKSVPRKSSAQKEMLKEVANLGGREFQCFGMDSMYSGVSANAGLDHGRAAAQGVFFIPTGNGPKKTVKLTTSVSSESRQGLSPSPKVDVQIDSLPVARASLTQLDQRDKRFSEDCKLLEAKELKGNWLGSYSTTCQRQADDDVAKRARAAKSPGTIQFADYYPVKHGSSDCLMRYIECTIPGKVPEQVLKFDRIGGYKTNDVQAVVDPDPVFRQGLTKALFDMHLLYAVCNNLDLRKQLEKQGMRTTEDPRLGRDIIYLPIGDSGAGKATGKVR